MKELERTILLLKKVVEKTRAENDQLKQGPGVMAGEKLTALQAENNQLKVSQRPGVMAGEKLKVSRWPDILRHYDLNLLLIVHLMRCG